MNEHIDIDTISVDDVWLREWAAEGMDVPRTAARRARRIRRIPPIASG